MADTLEFELVSPERLLLSERVEMVVVPGTEGDFGALPGHSPLISTIRPGTIAIYAGGVVTRRIFVAGGVAEVTPERCTVLAEEALPLDAIDRAAVESRIREAERAVSEAGSDIERATATSRLTTAQALAAALEQAPTR